MCFSKNDFHYVFWCILLENICPYLHTSNCFYYQLQLFRIKTFCLGQPCWSFKMWRKYYVWDLCTQENRSPWQDSNIGISGPAIYYLLDQWETPGWISSLFPFHFSQILSICFFLFIHHSPTPNPAPPLHILSGFRNIVSVREMSFFWYSNDMIECKNFIIYPVYVFQTKAKFQTNYWSTCALAMGKVRQL